ncbi:hypothetical protein D3C85_1445580 [compost metagenome]
MCDEILRIGRHVQFGAVFWQAPLAFPPGQQVCPVIGKGVRSHHAQVTGAQLVHHMREHAQLQVAPVSRRPLVVWATYEFPPALRGEADIDLGGDPLAVQGLVVEHHLQRHQQCARLAGRLPFQYLRQA